MAEPDVWMVNLLDRTGRHVVDPGPTFAFRAPLLPVAPEGARQEGQQLELGLEYEFLRARGATPTRVREGGREVERFVVRLGDAVVTLDGEPGKERPRRLRIEAPAAPPLELEYISYERDLPPRIELFERPEGIP